MDSFKIELELLADVLDKKETVLSQILSITENQKTVLEMDETRSCAASFFKEMNVEKQALIDKVLELDKIFEGIFCRLSNEFEKRAPSYREIVLGLQEKIKAVMDLDINIRVLENKNKDAVSKLNRPAKINTVSKNYLLEKYKKNK